MPPRLAPNFPPFLLRWTAYDLAVTVRAAPPSAATDCMARTHSDSMYLFRALQVAMCLGAAHGVGHLLTVLVRG